jgi:hypothetical protein
MASPTGARHSSTRLSASTTGTVSAPVEGHGDQIRKVVALPLALPDQSSNGS